jgi:hypothetical protein
MERILALRFAPFNFSAIPGFPNVVPTPNQWGDYLPIFREGKRTTLLIISMSFMNSCINGEYIMRIYY